VIQEGEAILTNDSEPATKNPTLNEPENNENPINYGNIDHNDE